MWNPFKNGHISSTLLWWFSRQSRWSWISWIVRCLLKLWSGYDGRFVAQWTRWSWLPLFGGQNVVLYLIQHIRDGPKYFSWLVLLRRIFLYLFKKYLCIRRLNVFWNSFGLWVLWLFAFDLVIITYKKYFCWTTSLSKMVKWQFFVEF